MKIIKYDAKRELIKEERIDIVNFLHQFLGKYTDTKEDIDHAITYALSGDAGRGGFILAGYEDEQLVAALVMNHTGMTGYIPEHILVYIAVDSACRGKGYGGKVIQEAFVHAPGAVALHVDLDNPAHRLYERIGFQKKYWEMRYYPELPEV